MLNQTAEYALRAVTELAGQGPDEFVQASELSSLLGIPANYLSKILHQLAGAGVLESRRGPRGGFRWAAPAATLALLRVVEPFDSIGEGRRCVLGGAVCSDRTACAAHERWKPISNAMHDFLRETTVAQLQHDKPARRSTRRKTRVSARASG